VEVRSAFSSRLGAEAGFSLIELMLVVSLLVVVLTAVISLLETTTRLAPREQERSIAIRDAQVGLDRMVRDLRHTYRVIATTDSSMEVLMTVRRVNAAGQTVYEDRHVLYRCNVPHPTNADRRRCVKVEAAAAAALPAISTGEVVIDRVLPGGVFTFSPGPLAPRYVTARVTVPAAGERADGFAHSFTLDDGFYLRNTALAE
jgi:prepilin-type N-terminal cleavage/methylation domain-containing protein